MPRPALSRELHEGLPDALREAVDEFARHLALERGRSEHTVRAYVGDVVSLLDHGARMGITDVGGLTIAVLRSWLARLRTTGRLGAPWLAGRRRPGRSRPGGTGPAGCTVDTGAGLVSPREHRPLPHVLRTDQAEALVTAPVAQPEGALGLRDALVLELLYASGVRVSELCGLDVDDVDLERNVVRVMGKGGKERGVPMGIPARDALRRWLE